ncbi:MAG: hypothetical protein A2845_01130 [Candidatus Lloydbacteria bacterium RIFCSPHIGHO2_01_FULL_49_22]|uniref:Predicted membrane protein YciQ-like C-terminal domain-containing protein n=1 Tax=Candidatus Lloydbacteria bacterium RIFCSPHIGHO2_01_FULL_49_22 TaxID=1798658 RepID=A0A1G2CWH9_9BACT|nr:MAG: hypothetical protein A2845_01130 [Candidatus Lloydbacteria bacterium RIFCSPHIGHO2_01_FULL_49_22]OGZ09227.1 MAG: hypothetical protein A3C14_06135 [Candidatus Lloydbacteria bacterium RIFCSPHIGHO2_02_FULL_50_18]
MKTTEDDESRVLHTAPEGVSPAVAELLTYGKVSFRSISAMLIDLLRRRYLIFDGDGCISSRVLEYSDRNELSKSEKAFLEFFFPNGKRYETLHDWAKFKATSDGMGKLEFIKSAVSYDIYGTLTGMTENLLGQLTELTEKKRNALRRYISYLTVAEKERNRTVALTDIGEHLPYLVALGLEEHWTALLSGGQISEEVERDMMR